MKKMRLRKTIKEIKFNIPRIERYFKVWDKIVVRNNLQDSVMDIWKMKYTVPYKWKEATIIKVNVCNLWINKITPFYEIDLDKWHNVWTEKEFY